MVSNLIPIILAGGKGERFWPLSRQHRPKQLLSLDGSGNTLLRSTANRLQKITGNWSNIWVITSAKIAEPIAENLPEILPNQILVEPEGRDTAAAVAWGSIMAVNQHGEDAMIGFFPADHYIGNLPNFQETIQAAVELAKSQDAIVTIGINPQFPSTGYGYIKQGVSVVNYERLTAYKVEKFTEKPDRHTAQEFLKTQQYSWNSGIFIFRAQVVINELKKYAPEIINPIIKSGIDAYAEIPKKSIDYALMEKTDLAYVIPAEFGWDDLGDWQSMERINQPNHALNIELGHHLGLDTTGAIIYGQEDELIVTIGLDDVVIVRDGNVTLVAQKDRTQDIKEVLKKISGHEQWQDLL